MFQFPYFKSGFLFINRHRFYIFPFFLLCVGGPDIRAQSEAIETAGDVLLFAMPASALGSSLIIGDTRGTWQFTKGFLLNQGVTFALKAALNKPRPFDNGDNAFPSGHTSTTFQAASFIQRRYGWAYGIPAYALAGFTGFSRLNAQKHDGWDILAGAALGIGSTYLFTTPYQRERMDLSFSGGKGQYVIGFRYKF